MRATFHERQYELAANLELIASGGMYFAPMQVIEDEVGYDIALVPGHAVVWSQLGVGATPPGVATPVAYDPSLKPVPGGLTFAASLFLQYKRPERMVRRNARETIGRKSQGGGVPFFRVRLNGDQHAVLLDLESRVGGDAVVRYAAPRFHQIEELWVRQSTRAVFVGSTFIAPSQAGTTPSCWTYDEPGVPIFCSRPRRGEPELGEDVFRALVRSGRERGRRSTAVHLRVLAPVLGEIDLTAARRRRRLDEIDESAGPGERQTEEGEHVRPPLKRREWAERLRAVAPDASEADLQAAVDASVIANAAAAIGLTWLLAEIQAQSV